MLNYQYLFIQFQYLTGLFIYVDTKLWYWSNMSQSTALVNRNLQLSLMHFLYLLRHVFLLNIISVQNVYRLTKNF